MDYCAEVSYIRCNNGYRLPMEITFARMDNPRQVFILHMRMPHDVYFTVTDLVCNKGQCERRNKGFNVNARCILKMDKKSWWHTLQHFIHDHMGGMPSWPFAPKIKNNFLRSCSNPGYEFESNASGRLKKAIQCKEDKLMDKLDEKQLLEAIDKLLEECDELMDQYPGEETPLEAMDKL
ncbi:hypothetical protein TNCT_677081 [Trichonephila clavata]|uniref:Uncharacterized protein n=1 Tax=Trichonephila clavata TaxID=2740835 RepID=A0A8X6KM31_TRICU|nr:hypothetical protein TNCT_677081 [Trichonephila clavata]